MDLQAIAQGQARSAAPLVTPLAVAPTSTTSGRLRLPRTFLRYAAVGVLSLVVDAGTLWLLYDIAHVNLLVATSAGFWLSFAVNFTANRSMTFAASNGLRRQLMRYGVVVALSYLSNVGIVAGLVAWGLPAVLSKLIAVSLLTGVNFGAYKYWVFRD